MKPEMQKGIGLAKTGLKVIKGGQAALRWGRRLKRLPPLREKAERKAAAKAIKKEEKQTQCRERKECRKRQGRLLCRNARGAGRLFLALRRKYF